MENLTRLFSDIMEKRVLAALLLLLVCCVIMPLKELRYSLKVFAPYRNRRKVTVFGSARLPLEHPACQAAIQFGRRMAEAGYMVITGAASGIMEAGHVGAGRERSIGVNILLPFEQAANPVIRGDHKLMNLKYFFTRKLVFVKESDAVALFPGGFGTQDEGFEVLTLVQTGKSHLFPIVMVDVKDGGYWEPWDAYVKNVLLARGFISPADMALYKSKDAGRNRVTMADESFKKLPRRPSSRMHPPGEQPAPSAAETQSPGTVPVLLDIIQSKLAQAANNPNASGENDRRGK